MLFYSNFVCYNQVFAPKSGLLSQKMPNAVLIKSAVVFASIRYLFSQTLAASRHEKLNYSLNFTLYIFTLVHGSITQLLFEKKDAVQ